eukprot:GILJ01015880.1.p1 GENE.GILJ01015880.1~~GILJ01015880.1.p1  ORF type:complete len:385 (-),score=104.86 GILJ01015880.1:83-1237(-)
MGKNPPKWLPGDRVKETILLQRKSVDELRADRILRKDKLGEKRQKHKNKIDAKRKRKLSTKKFISAQTILKYAQRQKHQARNFHKIGEKIDSKVKTAGEEKMSEKFTTTGVALLVRCKGDLVPKSVRQAFDRLGLTKIYTARLVHVGPATYKLLQQLKPFSILGYPSEEHIDKLIRTRGCLWNLESKTKRFISGNRLLEEALGQYGVLCVEDLTAAIYHKDEKIDEILTHLAPFDFHPPRMLFMERHRTAHQKLEIINPESFASYLAEQLGDAAKEGAAAARQKAVDSANQERKVDAAKRRAADAKAKLDEAEAAEKAKAEAAVTSPAKATASPASKKVAATPKNSKKAAKEAEDEVESTPVAAAAPTPSKGKKSSAKKRVREE